MVSDPKRIVSALPLVMACAVGVFLAVAARSLDWSGTTVVVVGSALVAVLALVGTPLLLLTLERSEGGIDAHQHSVERRRRAERATYWAYVMALSEQQPRAKIVGSSWTEVNRSLLTKDALDRVLVESLSSNFTERWDLAAVDPGAVAVYEDEERSNASRVVSREELLGESEKADKNASTVRLREPALG